MSFTLDDREQMSRQAKLKQSSSQIIKTRAFPRKQEHLPFNMPTQKPEKIKIDNPKYNLSQGGSFPFNQVSARGLTFQYSKDPNFIKS